MTTLNPYLGNLTGKFGTNWMLNHEKDSKG